jgi:hypothetical protein
MPVAESTPRKWAPFRLGSSPVTSDPALESVRSDVAKDHRYLVAPSRESLSRFGVVGFP